MKSDAFWHGVLWARDLKNSDKSSYLAGSEYFRDLPCVHADETNVGKRLLHVCGKFFIFFNCTQEHTGIAFDTDIINLRVPAGQSEKKLPFPHSDLNMDRMSVSEDLFPVVLVFGCILNNFFTFP